MFFSPVFDHPRLFAFDVGWSSRICQVHELKNIWMMVMVIIMMNNININVTTKQIMIVVITIIVKVMVMMMKVVLIFVDKPYVRSDGLLSEERWDKIGNI